ncbi:nuclease [Arenimonas soli]|uniref:Nuclease n=1 Tax=Arenimonas soli TaxID=2269504 RepID=A0ABQ1HAK2_9GAMM|nr:lamin tail domain-containing protein [Arenimonas soli]GGA66588.1 nuclease [Arenimonas soli]
MRHHPRLHALCALLFLPLAAQAATADLLISEVIEGSSNNKAVEIHNGTGAPVDLSAGGYTLQFYFNGNTSPGTTLALSGTLADGDVYVLAPASATAAILAQADQTGGTWFNGDDAIVLRRGGSAGPVVDSLGQVGVDPGSQWGSGLVSTADNTLRRLATVCAGDTTPDDAFDPALEWEGYAQDTFDGLGSHATNCGGTPQPTDPTATGSASPASLAAGDDTVLTVQVTPGANPASTGLVVSADLEAIGGSAGQAFRDDGLSGDLVANDLEFTWAGTVAPGTSPGPKSLPVQVADDQGRSGAGTINLSVAIRVGIAGIQGQGIGSPLPVGTEVVTEGIVTARRGNGYFIQSAPGEDDGDPATAEGVFVFTSAPPPADAAVGNRVRVAGRVSEFSRTPHGYPLTQLNWASLTVLATGQALPAPVVIDDTVLAPTVALDALGRYQGMRVVLPAATVVGPTNGFGDFHVTLPGVPRPVREPGIAALDAVPLPPGNAIPVFDRNPERLRVESLGLEGGSAFNLDAGASVQGMEGILYYDRGDFTLLLGQRDATTSAGGALVAAVPAVEEGAVRIASYNIQNLSGGESVPLDRLAKLTDVFCQYLRTPDVVGLVEIGNLETARRLARAINEDEFDNCPDNPAYEAYLLSTSGSQRLGYLVKTAPVADGQPRVEVRGVVEHFVGEPLVAPDGSINPSLRLFDRPPLQLDARVNDGNGRQFPVQVLLNHNLSLLDTNNLSSNAQWGTVGNRSREKRKQQAERLSQLVESIQQADPAMPLVLVGDFNAFEFSDGYVDVMGIIAGTPAPADEVLLAGQSAVTRPLVNLIGTRPVDQRYSYVFEGNAQNLDHALVNQAVLEATEATLYHARVNSDFAADLAADPTVPVRSSDHDPLVADLVVPAFLDADLAVLVAGPFVPVHDGQRAPFLALVGNLGQSRALRPELVVHLDARPDQLLAVHAEGWLCDAPVADGDGSRLACGREEALAPGGFDLLRFDLQARRETVQDQVGLHIQARTRSNDTYAGNDSDGASVKVVGRPRSRGGH